MHTCHVHGRVIKCTYDMVNKPSLLDMYSRLACILLRLLGLRARHNLWSSGIAMSTGGSQSQRWSCGTLQDGVALVDLSLEEQKLLQDIQATLTVSDWVRTTHLNQNVDIDSFIYSMFSNPFSEQALDDEIALAEKQADSSGGSKEAWNWVCPMYMCNSQIWSCDSF